MRYDPSSAAALLSKLLRRAFSKIVDFSQVLFGAAEQGKDGGGDRGAEKGLRGQVERGD